MKENNTFQAIFRRGVHLLSPHTSFQILPKSRSKTKAFTYRLTWFTRNAQNIICFSKQRKNFLFVLTPNDNLKNITNFSKCIKKKNIKHSTWLRADSAIKLCCLPLLAQIKLFSCTSELLTFLKELLRELWGLGPDELYLPLHLQSVRVTLFRADEQMRRCWASSQGELFAVPGTHPSLPRVAHWVSTLRVLGLAACTVSSDFYFVNIFSFLSWFFLAFHLKLG